MLHVLTLSSLFPDETRPNFGIFVERQTAGLAQRAGVDARVVAPVGLPVWPLRRSTRFAAMAALPSYETWRGLEVHRPRFTTVPGTGGRWHVRALVAALIPLMDRLHAERPFDVIDASFFFPDGPAAVALGRRYGVPVSIKARGADIHLWGRAPATAGQVLAAARGADGMLAVSGAMRGDMIALGMPGERIAVHHTGIDHDRFRPRARAAAKRAASVAGPLVVSLGALIPRKGHDIVLDAVARLPGVSVWIAGEGPERARLTERIAALGIGDRARLLGSVAHEAMPQLLAMADVMALASSSEGLANAWVEALACGTPIVITDAGGAGEVVTGPTSGRVVARDCAAFAAGIAAVLAEAPDPAAVRASVAGFSWETNAATLHAHLAGLVARRQASSG
ncbi:glycosyltransferase [Sphingomonas sp.]|uniref:glycosyltransferase n=1 Tax=Sphingomonas sp. TaxID=28214 RepID=UPI0035B173C5